MNSGTTVSQANVEYFFRLLYNCIHGGCYQNVPLPDLSALLAQIWLWIIYAGYALSIIGLGLIVYSTMRIFELRKREAEYYGTVILAPDEISGGHPRWENIQDLLAGSNPSQWREAIIEADIMLDEALTKAGYEGETISEKLKTVDRAQLTSLQDAWEAHKVRNQIAHEGSAYELTEQFARRTIARYESVFRELHEIK